MLTIIAQIAPQRSTQYRELATDLAPPELFLSPLGQHIGRMEVVNLGGQDYIKADLDTDLDDKLIAELGTLATMSAYFRYYEDVADIPGPLLAPIELSFEPTLPPDIVMSRRYRGKTNELFTQFMCNIARATYGTRPWKSITLLDPLAGGGTTLLTGLILGADVVGVEQDKSAVDSTVAFLKQYFKEMKIPNKSREDRLKQVGRRWWFELPMRCVIGRGDTQDVAAFTHGLKRPQLIVTDMPYGIQHNGELVELVHGALPAWHDAMADDGVMVFSWDATRFPRDEMIELVEASKVFKVENEPPYNQLAHRVDRVIKQRDVIVAYAL